MMFLCKEVVSFILKLLKLWGCKFWYCFGTMGESVATALVLIYFIFPAITQFIWHQGGVNFWRELHRIMMWMVAGRGCLWLNVIPTPLWVTNAVMLSLSLMDTWHVCGRWYASDLPHSHHWHLSVYPTMAQRLVSGAEYIFFQVSSQEVTVCVISALVANFLPARYFLRHPKRCKLLGPYCQSHLWLAVTLWLNDYGPSSLQSQSHAQ